MIPFLDNPIFVREFRNHARCRKTLFLSLGALVALSLILLALWPRTGVFSETNSNEIFSVFLNINLALVILLIPGFVATTVTEERENRSFDLLVTSLLTPRQIMFGKLFSALGIAFLVVAVSLPVTSVCALSGGIGVPLLLRTYAVIFMTTLTYGLLGLAVSSLCHRSFTALALTYIGVMFLAGATWLPSVLMPYPGGIGTLFRKFRCLSPFEALFALSHPEGYEVAVVGISAGDAFTFFFLGMVCIAAGSFLIFCFFVMRPPSRTRPRKDKQHYDDRSQSLKRKLGFPFYLIDPLKRKKPIGPWRNPIFVAEIRSRIFGNPKVILRSLSVCVVISLLLLLLVTIQFATTLSPDTVRMVAIVFQVGVVAFFAPAVCTGSITDEKISGTLELLSMTGIPLHTVIIGKIKAGFLYVLIFLVSATPVLWAVAYLETDTSYWRVAVWCAILMVTTATFVVAGLCASSVSPTTGTATVLSYAFSAVICLGTLGVRLFGTRIAPELQAFILSFNPLAAALQVTSDSCLENIPPLFGNRLWLNNIIFMGCMSLVLVAVSILELHRVFVPRKQD